jgi:hypothetical protein
MRSQSKRNSKHPAGLEFRALVCEGAQRLELVRG